MNDINEEKKQAHMEEYMKTILSKYKKYMPEQVVAMLDFEFAGCSHKDKELRLSFATKPWELNPGNTMHGGVIVTAFDTVFGCLAHYLADNDVVTVSINSTFMKPVLPNDKLIIRAKALSVGRNVINVTGDLINEKTGKTLCASTATFMSVKPRS